MEGEDHPATDGEHMLKVSSLKKQVKQLKSLKQRKKICLIVDGPNMLRKDISVSLSDIRVVLGEFGAIKIGVVILNRNAPDKLVEAITNHGLKPVISAGDTAITLSVVAMEFIMSPKFDIFALATRNAVFLPLVLKAKERGLETLVIGADPGFSVALQNAADIAVNLSAINRDGSSRQEA